MTDAEQSARAMPLDEARKRFPALYIIYDHPLDFPDYFVVRRWYGLRVEPGWHLTTTLDEARAYANRHGATALLSRADTDDPNILESWL